MRYTPFILLSLVLLTGCESSKRSTTDAAIRFVDGDRDAVRNVEVFWTHEGLPKAEKHGPFKSNRKGDVFLPRHTVNSTRHARYAISFQHPSFQSGAIYYFDDGTSYQYTEGVSTPIVRPYLRGSYLIQLSPRGS